MKAKDIRKSIIETGHHATGSGAHFGSSLSCVDILVALYDHVLRLNDNETRDRFILSKGHAALALYCVLKEKGLLTQDELDSFEKDGTLYPAHAKRNISKGIEFSGGSLSLGVSYAVGVALACKKKNNHIYVLMGDGECEEGLVWEAVMAAANYGLNNLTIIVDKNGLQSDGFVQEVMDVGSLTSKFTAFGWEAIEVDGHDIEVLCRQLLRNGDRPKCIVAKTIKGKGVSFMEGNPKGHHAKMNHNMYEQALTDLEG